MEVVGGERTDLKTGCSFYVKRCKSCGYMVRLFPIPTFAESMRRFEDRRQIALSRIRKGRARVGQGRSAHVVVTDP